MINKSAIDRGLYVATAYRTITEEERKKGMSTSNETICLPPLDARRRDYNYNYLDDRGLIRKGTVVKKGIVLVGKIITKSSKDSEKIIDCSLAVKNGEEGTVDRVICVTTPNGYKLVKVVIRNTKIPEVGDKFASRSAQKGTTGFVYRQEDMPFTADGIVPDIIMNPHALPSRMTINQLMECVLGKACALEGSYGDATPFTEADMKGDMAEQICKRLEKFGYERHGWEQMYNGMTGEPIEAKIFIGPTYYQRLKHMVSEKCHSRAQGHVTTLTRQPLEGRSRDGGLRFGEMERDAMLAHGVSRFLKERLFDQSDPYQITVCNKCGNICLPKECQSCQTDQVSVCNFPYAAKLVIQELQAMSIRTSIRPKLDNQ